MNGPPQLEISDADIQSIDNEEAAMFNKSSGAKQYGKVNVESKVLSADPHRLVALLFDGAIEAVSQAREHAKAKRKGGQAAMTSKAVAIILEGLQASLNKSHGGEIADRLDALYDYLVRRLMAANVQGDDAGFVEVLQLMTDLRSAWADINPAQKPAESTDSDVAPTFKSDGTRSQKLALA